MSSAATSASRREFTPGHFAPFYPAPEKLISYHYVRSGKLIVELDGLPPVTLEAGAIAILPRNDATSVGEPRRPAPGRSE